MNRKPGHTQQSGSSDVAIALALLLVSCSTGCHAGTSVANIPVESLATRDSVEFTGTLIRNGDSLIVNVILTNRGSVPRTVGMGECVVTLMVLGNADHSRLIWDQREGLSCPDAEALYTIDAGEQRVITRAISIPELRQAVPSLAWGNYGVAARVATSDDPPPVVLAGTAYMY